MKQCMVKPKIGTMAIGLKSYWAQFPGMKAHLEAKHEELLQKLDGKAELIKCGMVDTIELSAEAGRRFKEADVDLVFIQSMTYATSNAVIPAVKDLDVPIIILNIQEVPCLDFKNVNHIDDWLGHGIPCAGVPELTAVFNAYGLRYDVITGYLHGDCVVDQELDRWCKAAQVRARMRASSVGILGRQFYGMLDLYLNENTIMKQFGMMTVFLMWEDVIKYAQEVTAEEKQKNLEMISKVFFVPDTVAESELENIAVMYGGYMKLVEKYNLSVVANHFEREMIGKEIDMIAALNPANTMMISEGIACTVEGDLKAGIAMLILKTIAGSANLSELYSMDFHNDVLILGHSGASDPAISDVKPILNTTSVFHGKSGKGFTTQAVPRTGPITLLALVEKQSGGFKMIASEGIVEKGEILNLGDTNCRVRFEIPMRDFTNKWCMAGPSHHGVMGSGLHVNTLAAVAKVLNVEFEVIGKKTNA